MDAPFSCFPQWRSPPQARCLFSGDGAQHLIFERRIFELKTTCAPHAPRVQPLPGGIFDTTIRRTLAG